MRNKWILLCRAIVCSFIFIGSMSVYAETQLSLIPSNQSLDNEVLDVAEDPANNALYVAGHFSGVYEKLGGGAIFHSDGHLNTINKLNFNGQPRSSISDHRGGFYVGGSFSNINATGIKYLVHIISDGSIDTDFNPRISGPVAHLALIDNNLYVATHSQVFKIDTTTGQVDPGFSITTQPNTTAATGISMVATNNGVFIAGRFTQINGRNHAYFAKANLENGSIDTNFYSSSVQVSSIAASTDGKLFILEHSRDKRIMKIDQVTGTLDANFNLALPLGSSNWIAIDDNELYVPLLSKPFLARYSAVSGEKDTAFKITTLGRPAAFAFDTNYIYIAALFNGWPGSRYYRNVARFNKSTQIIDNTYVASVNRNILTLSLSEGKLFTGGYFTVGGMNQGQQGLIKFDLTTGKVDPFFKPALNGSVKTVTFDDNNVYVGGTFTTANNIKTGKLAKLSKFTGEVDKNFRPQPNGYINRLKVHDGYLYVGGHFSKISGRYLSKGLARYKLDGMVYDTVFHPHFNHMVWAMTFAGDSLYVGGTFKNRLEKYNVVTGERDLNFNPATPEGTVKNILIDGDNLYAVGYFWDGIHKLNRFTGLADALFKPGVERALWASVAEHDGHIYVGGKNTLLRLDEHTGAIDNTFNPNPNGYVYGMLFNGNDLTAYGTFTSIQGDLQPYFATMSLS
ncbi:MAG: hypothetical protein P1U34_11435 [Coxiellaceae bacterium]|nr:hypothetical protein [Coxiellaceae bacterium]